MLLCLCVFLIFQTEESAFDLKHADSVSFWPSNPSILYTIENVNTIVCGLKLPQVTANLNYISSHV